MSEKGLAGDWFNTDGPPPLPPKPVMPAEPEPAVEQEADTSADDVDSSADAKAPVVAEPEPSEPPAAKAPAKKDTSKQTRSKGPAKSAAGKADKAASSAATAEADDQGRIKVSIKVPTEIRDRLRLERIHTTASFTDIALDAVELNLDEVQKRIASQRPTRREGGLFGRVYTQRAVQETNSDADPRVQINLFLYPDDLATIETLSEKASARDRTHFLNVALEIHLKKEKKKAAS